MAGGSSPGAPSSPNTLENFAQDVYSFHVRRQAEAAGVVPDPSRSGAEYWVQCRGGHDGAGGEVEEEVGEGQGGAEGQSINWHFDKDEELLDLCGLYSPGR